MKRTLLIISLILLPLLLQAAAPLEESDLIYVFALVYDRGALRIDPEARLPYEIVVERYTPERIVGSGFYQARVMSFTDEELASISFDPQKGSPAFTTGKVSVKVPYFDNAERVLFYRGEEEIFSVAVAETNRCNEDGECTAEIETPQNCPTDCSVSGLSDGSSESGNRSKLLIALLILALLAVVGGGAVALVRFRNRPRGAEGAEPPSTPPAGV
jgi:hypothetical protein